MVRQISIAIRAGLGFGAVALLVFLLGGFSLQQMTTMQRESVEVSEHWLPAILRMGDVNQQFLRIRAATLRLLLADSPTNQRTAVAAIEKTKVEFRQAREEVDPLIRTAEGRSIITRFDKAMADYERFQTQIVELALKGDLDGARALTRGELNQHADAASQAVGGSDCSFPRKSSGGGAAVRRNCVECVQRSRGGDAAGSSPDSCPGFAADAQYCATTKRGCKCCRDRCFGRSDALHSGDRA